MNESQCSRTGGVRFVVVPSIARALVRLAVEDETQDFRRAEERKGFFEEFSGCFVGCDDHHIPVDPLGEQAAVRSREYRRSVDDDVVVSQSRFANELAKSLTCHKFVRIRLRATGGHDRQLEWLQTPGDLFQAASAIE